MTDSESTTDPAILAELQRIFGKENVKEISNSDGVPRYGFDIDSFGEMNRNEFIRQFATALDIHPKEFVEETDGYYIITIRCDAFRDTLGALQKTNIESLISGILEATENELLPGKQVHIDFPDVETTNSPDVPSRISELNALYNTDKVEERNVDGGQYYFIPRSVFENTALSKSKKVSLTMYRKAIADILKVKESDIKYALDDDHRPIGINILRVDIDEEDDCNIISLNRLYQRIEPKLKNKNSWVPGDENLDADVQLFENSPWKR